MKFSNLVVNSRGFIKNSTVNERKYKKIHADEVPTTAAAVAAASTTSRVTTTATTASSDQKVSLQLWRNRNMARNMMLFPSIDSPLSLSEIKSTNATATVASSSSFSSKTMSNIENDTSFALLQTKSAEMMKSQQKSYLLFDPVMSPLPTTQGSAMTTTTTMNNVATNTSLITTNIIDDNNTNGNTTTTTTNNNKRMKLDVHDDTSLHPYNLLVVVQKNTDDNEMVKEQQPHQRQNLLRSTSSNDINNVINNNTNDATTETPHVTTPTSSSSSSISRSTTIAGVMNSGKGDCKGIGNCRNTRKVRFNLDAGANTASKSELIITDEIKKELWWKKSEIKRSQLLGYQQKSCRMIKSILDNILKDCRSKAGVQMSSSSSSSSSRSGSERTKDDKSSKGHYFSSVQIIDDLRGLEHLSCPTSSSSSFSIIRKNEKKNSFNNIVLLIDVDEDYYNTKCCERFLAATSRALLSKGSRQLAIAIACVDDLILSSENVDDDVDESSISTLKTTNTSTHSKTDACCCGGLNTTTTTTKDNNNKTTKKEGNNSKRNGYSGKPSLIETCELYCCSTIGCLC